MLNVNGLGIAIICLLIIILQFVVHKFIKKATNTYGGGLTLSIFFLIGFIVFRFKYDGQYYASHVGQLDGKIYGEAIHISRAFMLDICPFMGLFLPIALIIDPTRKLAKAAAPLAILGGLIIVFIQMPGEDLNSDTSPTGTLKGIFLGLRDGISPMNRCYFIIHAFNLFCGIGVMLNTPRYSLKGVFSCIALAAIYYSYVAIMAHILKCHGFVSGLNINDGDSGEYGIVANTILKCSPQIAAAGAFSLSFLLCIGFMASKDFFFSRFNGGKFGNVYSKKGYAGYDYNKFIEHEPRNEKG